MPNHPRKLNPTVAPSSPSTHAAVEVMDPSADSSWLQVPPATTSLAGAHSSADKSKSDRLVDFKQFGAVGDGTTDNAGALTALLAASVKRVRLTDGVYFFASDATFPSTMELVFDLGAKLKPASGKVCKLGRVRAHSSQQIFDVSLGGSISLAQAGAEPIVYVEWFGAVADGSGGGVGTDNTVAINAAIEAVAGSVNGIESSSVGGRIRFGSSSVYLIKGTIEIRSDQGVNGVRLEGHLGGSSGHSTSTRLLCYFSEPTAASTTGISGGHLTLAGLGGISPAPAVGGWLCVYGAANARNNGAFLVTDFTAGVATVKLPDIQAGTVAVDGATAGQSCTVVSVTRPAIRMWSADNIVQDLIIESQTNGNKYMYAAVDETMGPAPAGCSNNLFRNVRVVGDVMALGYVHGDNYLSPGNSPYPSNCENTRWVDCRTERCIFAEIFCPNTGGQSKKCEVDGGNLVGNGDLKRGYDVYWLSGSILMRSVDIGGHLACFGFGELEMCLIDNCQSETAGRLFDMACGGSGAHLRGGRYNVVSAEANGTDGSYIRFTGARLVLDGLFFDVGVNAGTARILAHAGFGGAPYANVIARNCLFPSVTPFEEASGNYMHLEQTGCYAVKTDSSIIPLRDVRRTLVASHDTTTAAAEERVGWDVDGLLLNAAKVYRSVGSGTGSGLGVPAWSTDAPSRLQTADASPHVIASYAIPDGSTNNNFGNGSLALVEAEVVACEPGAAHSATWTLKRGFDIAYNHVASPAGSTVVLASGGTNAGAPPSAWSVLLDTDGMNLTLTAQNTGGQPVNWTVTKYRVVIAS